MRQPISPHAVIVSQQSYESDNPYELIMSNIAFVNTLIESYVYYSEIDPDALRSYFVDYYFVQRNNGGFSQFVYNSGWTDYIVAFVREGLQAMGASQQLHLFEKSAALLDKLGTEQLTVFFESDYFGDNPERDLLDTLDERFTEVNEHEDLIALNATWLRKLSNLVILSVEQMDAEIQRRKEAIPDLDQRIATARANEPNYMQIIRSLCEQAGHELVRVTGAKPGHEHHGQLTLAWYFITDQGPHYMIELEGKTQMFDVDTQTSIAEIRGAVD